MKKKFKIAYIHMGSDKTGSTAIQSFMDTHRDVNRSSYGIFYAPERWHARFASYFSGSDKNFIHNIESNIKDEQEIYVLDKHYIESLEQQLINLTTEKVLVFSYEGFHGLTIEALSNMKEYLSKYAEEIKIIYYVRAPFSYALSGISQYVRSGRYVNEHPPVQPYKKYLTNFQKVFKKEDILLKKFSMDSLYQHDIVADFLFTINKKYNLDTYLKNKKLENEGLSDIACLIGNEVIEKYFSSEKRKNASPFELGVKILPYIEKINGKKLKLTKSQSINVIKNSEENSRYIKSEFNIDLSEDLEKFIYSDKEMSKINSILECEEYRKLITDILYDVTNTSDGILEKPQIDIKTVCFEDIKNNSDIDFLRDEALRIESFDIETAFKLMELANRARPDGPFIKEKLNSYKKILSTK